MAGIGSEVLETFLAELASVDDVPTAIAEKLEELLSAAKLPKPEQLTALYAEASGEPLL